MMTIHLVLRVIEKFVSQRIRSPRFKTVGVLVVEKYIAKGPQKRSVCKCGLLSPNVYIRDVPF